MTLFQEIWLVSLNKGMLPRALHVLRPLKLIACYWGDFLFIFFWPGIYVFLVGDSQYCHLILPPVAEGLLLTAHPSHHFN